MYVSWKNILTNLKNKYGCLWNNSQQNWKAAKDKGLLDAEMAPVILETKAGTKIMDTDEHPRPDVTLEKLGKLNPVFKKDGVVTAANASGICDGAASIVVASEHAVEKYKLQPLARLVSYGITGCDPTIMGIGPVSAIRQALQRSNVAMSQVDRIEINEAFAAQFLACAMELDIDMDKTNLHGGAISLGHPTGASGTLVPCQSLFVVWLFWWPAGHVMSCHVNWFTTVGSQHGSLLLLWWWLLYFFSGARIVAHLAHEFHQEGSTAQLSIGSACIGGGQGIAILLEKA